MVTQTPSALDLVREGESLRHRGDYVQAERNFRAAVSQDPGCERGWAELGCVLADRRQFSEAADCFRRISGVKPDGSDSDPIREAIALLAQIAGDRPAWARGQFSLGAAYEIARDHRQARLHLSEAIRLNPGWFAAAEAMSARMYLADQQWFEAIETADQVLQRDARCVLAHLVRGCAYAALGRMNKATSSIRRAIEIQPDLEFHNCLVFDMNYLPEITPEAVFAEASRWSALYAAPLAPHIVPHANIPDPERRLRVGYVSPDLFHHPMMKFLPPVLDHHDPAQVEVFVYSIGKMTDVFTERLRQQVGNYVPLRVNHVELAQRIRDDGIDILIDLAGQTMGPSLLTFAMKPAPVQISWIGALCTTGMPTMDYFLGDAYLPCPATEHLFSECVYRLPRPSYCYRPLEDIPVARSPFHERGYITFGCYNNTRKVNRRVVQLWATILHLSPDSRLLLKYHGLEDERKQMHLRKWFDEDGIAPDRLSFEGASAPAQYYAAYGQIDVALDPFPYNGGTTTLDALWMGVPVVTLTGRPSMQSCGASELAAVGLVDSIARTPEQYVVAALLVAESVRKIPEIRTNIRKAFLCSPLRDEVGLVRTVESAFRDMWRKWCATQA